MGRRTAGLVVASLLALVLGISILYAARSEAPPTAQPTPSSSPIGAPSPSLAVGEVSEQVTPTALPADVHFLVVGQGSAFRVVLIDVVAGRARDVVALRVGPSNPNDGPYVFASASRDGRTLLVTVNVPGARSTVLLVRPDSGEARELYRGSPFDRAIVSPDGTRYALSRGADDPAISGVWVGSTAGGAPRRLLGGDDPRMIGAPPFPASFSPDGRTLAVRVGLGDSGGAIYLLSADGPEARIERDRAGTPSIVGADATAVGGSQVDFGDGRQLLVWSSRNAFGGETFVSVYDPERATSSVLYRPTADLAIEGAAWHPSLERFVTVERPFCCGLSPARTIWIRARDGSARKVVESPFVGEVWWSADGSRLFATMGGDDATGRVVELLSGAGVATYCLRGGGPPCP